MIFSLPPLAVIPANKCNCRWTMTLRTFCFPSFIFLSFIAVVHDHKIFSVPALLKQASVIPSPLLPQLEKVSSIEVLGTTLRNCSVI